MEPTAPAGTAPSTGSDPATLDRISRQTLAGAAPFEVDLAETAAEREAAYRMRYRCAIEAGWAEPGDFPDGLERDQHDDEAIHILVHEREELAGTVRLVPPRPGRALPLEEAYGIEIPPRGEVVDGGRLVVARRHRGDSAHRVLSLLFTRFWLEARRLGFSRIAAVAPKGVIELYRNLNLAVEVLGPARDYWGDSRYPILISGTESAFAQARSGE